jgi:hypothetical protein
VIICFWRHLLPASEIIFYWRSVWRQSWPFPSPTSWFRNGVDPLWILWPALRESWSVYYSSVPSSN